MALKMIEKGSAMDLRLCADIADADGDADTAERFRLAALRIERMEADRKRLDKRIHCQRKALRDNWEIVEMRRKWLGSDVARKRYVDLYKRYKALQLRGEKAVERVEKER